MDTRHIPTIQISDKAWQLLKAEKRRPGRSQEEIDKDAVLLRAYGEGTDVLIDRERMSTFTHLLPTALHILHCLALLILSALLSKKHTD